MEYIAQLAAFVVTVFGVAGTTWDHEKAKLLKFTRTGWVIAVLAVVTLLVSLYIVYRADTEKRAAADQRKAVQSIAELEVCLAALRYKMVLDVMTHVASGAKTDNGFDVGLESGVLESAESVSALMDLNLLDGHLARASAGDLRPLQVFISEEVHEFTDLMNQTLSKYSGYLDKGLILDAARLTSHSITRRLLVVSDQVQQLKNTGNQKYPGLWPHESESYSIMVSTLDELLVETGKNPDVMGCSPPEFFEGGL